MGARRRLRQRRQRRQRFKLTLKLVALTLISVAVGATTAAFTATNTVAASRATDKTHTISVTELTPANCSSYATFYRISGPGGLNRFDAGHNNDTNQIWLGTAGRDNMAGGNGVDCMVPGGNNTAQAESVGGGTGNDYCYSGPGPGTYTFSSCANATHPTGPYTTVTSVTGGF
jgi:hypothetical protein